MGSKTRKKRIYAEREKVRHTTHWDMDYLPREVVDRQYLESPTESVKTTPQKKEGRRQRRLGLALICAGLALFAGAVLLGRFI